MHHDGGPLAVVLGVLVHDAGRGDAEHGIQIPGLLDLDDRIRAGGDVVAVVVPGDVQQWDMGGRIVGAVAYGHESGAVPLHASGGAFVVLLGGDEQGGARDGGDESAAVAEGREPARGDGADGDHGDETVGAVVGDGERAGGVGGLDVCGEAECVESLACGLDEVGVDVHACDLLPDVQPPAGEGCAVSGACADVEQLVAVVEVRVLQHLDEQARQGGG
ncbi:hypothetical protein SALBM135S_06289 [Streptomyces alboniger]